jgi:hypothetical protein
VRSELRCNQFVYYGQVPVHQYLFIQSLNDSLIDCCGCVSHLNCFIGGKIAMTVAAEIV